MALLDYLFAVIPMLGVLIFVHELGHFVVAKLCGVRVLKFSLGFGSPVGFGRHRMRWEHGGTEYVVAWFPLGGFVRMLGEQLPGDEPDGRIVPADARPDEFLNAKPTWQKLSISFAGPAANLLWPVLVFVLMLWVGIPKTASVVGMVERVSPAAEAGLRPGDRLVRIDGQPVRFWDEVESAIEARRSGALAVVVERGSQSLTLSVPIETRSALDPFGAVQTVGWIGAESRRLPALIGIPGSDTPAAAAGLRSGDRIVSVDGRAVEDWEELRAAYEESPGEVAVLQVAREVSGVKSELSIEVPVLGDLEALGFVSATILVGRVAEGSPAEAAGLRPRDLILAVDGRPVGSFQSFADTVRSSGGRPLEIVYARDGSVHSVVIRPEERGLPGPLEIEGMEQKVYQIGIVHALASLPGVAGLEQERNPILAVPRALRMSIDTTVVYLLGLGKLFTGEVGTDQLSGPIGIAEIARKSLDIGWQAYLFTMVFISINLGILNLMPIPILDGGQILIFSIEGIKRSPISLRTREVVQQIGVIVLILLMGLAFWNDLSRHWTRFIEWLSTEL